MKLVREKSRGNYILCVLRDVDEPEEPIREAYRDLNYRLRGTEPLMVHDLQRVPRVEAPVNIERVDSHERAEQLAKATGRRPLDETYFAPDAPIRQYMSVNTSDGQTIFGWVRSVSVPETNSSWVADMFVEPAHRRRGIGKAMLAHLLKEDRRRGCDRAVLTASHAGAMLYPQVGFKTVGVLLAYKEGREEKSS
ncbi:MAG: GNAT family N-acetyltransferase [Tepidisphaeraceae bacterium]